MSQPEDRPSTPGQTSPEEALREFQLVLLESQRQASMGSYVLDAATGIWTSSPALDELFGITDPAYTKDVQGWLRIVHPDDRDRMLRYFSDDVLTQHRPFDTEYRIVRLSDGAERWVHGRGRLTFDSRNRPIRMIGTIQDITERKQAEEALRKSEERYRRLHETMTDCFVEVDMAGRIRAVNSSYLQMLGYTLEEVCRLHYEDLTPPRWHDFERHIVDTQILPQGYSEVYHKEYIRKDGTIFPVELRTYLLKDDQGRPEGMWAVVRDITERKRVEQALYNSEAALRAMVDANPHIVALLDDQGVVLAANQVVARGFGKSHDEVIGHRILDFLPPEIVPSRWARMQEALRTGRLVHFEDQHSGRWMESYLQPIADAQGKPRRLALLAIDITGRKRAEEERLALQRQMEQTQRLESLGVLAGGIAHDFNNLLMVVLGYADLAARQASPMSPARESLAEIEKAGRRAAELCRQMLAYSGRGKFILETIDLRSLVEEMAHLLKATVSKKAMLTLDLEKSIPPIEGDASQVRQIVMNLITNASEAIGDRSGVIRISTGAMECSRAYLSGTYLDEKLSEGLYVYLEVADTGCGMSHETIARMFEPFFTTKFTGRGLGMAAVLGIVRGHKGAISISSVLGTGTTIRVHFPALRNETASAAAAAGADTPWTTRGRALLVEDEETLRLLGSRMLGLIGFEVLTAADGQQAVELYQARWNEIDVVVLDLTMPRMDGEETFRELRRINPDVRVIMSSGYSEHEISTRFAGKGLAGFLQKPYNLATLRELFRRLA
ncbi:MAG: PAS domain S-box protein [Tepidisphaerales bacterium]